MRLVYAWLRGRLRYGTAGRFAAISTVRLVVNVWVLVSILGFFGWRYLDAQRAQQKAQDLFYPFALREETTEEEADALWRLSREREGVRKAFYVIVFAKKLNADRFLKKSDHILQATLGLDDEYHRRLLGEIIKDNCYKEPASEYSNVCLNLLHALPPVHESKDVSGPLVGQIVELMAQAQDSWQLDALASGLGALGDKLPPEATENAFNRILDDMAQTQDFLPSVRAHTFAVPDWSALASGLGALGAKLPPEAAENAFNRILEVMDQTQNSGLLDALASVLGILGDKLSPEAAGNTANRIVEVMDQIQYSFELYPLACGLGALRDKLSSEVADNVAGRIVEVMDQTQNIAQLSVLTSALEALGAKLPPEAAENAADRIVEVMDETQDTEQLYALAHGLGGLGKKLRDDTAESSLRVLLGCFRPLEEPPCALAKSLIRNDRDHLEPIVELLKWSTCSSEDRAELIQQIAQVTGESFESEWAFIQWAKEQGYQPGRPPRDPEPLESVLKELTRQ